MPLGPQAAGAYTQTASRPGKSLALAALGGAIVAIARDNTTPPLSGYGPAAVLARGRSGVWHVFGHLAPASLGALKRGDVIRAGAFFARLAPGLRPPHVHWEPRRWRTEEPAARALGRAVSRGDIVIDPDLWLREAA